jgi:hypothetical protein
MNSYTSSSIADNPLFACEAFRACFARLMLLLNLSPYIIEGEQKQVRALPKREGQ